MNHETAERPKDNPDGTKLSQERTFLAYERTLLAWVRTAVSLITLGFTLYKFFQYLQQTDPARLAGRLLGPREYGMLMIGIGVFSLALATLRHRREMKRLRPEHAGAFSSQAVWLAGWVAGLGIVSFLAAIFRQ